MPQQIINGVGKAGFRSLPTGGGSSFDTDAQAFITATAITDTTQKNAINDLVLDLKAAGVWTKMKALYPMVGGTATTHKFNLKDPRDLDAAYRLTFAGGWTHSSTGALPNGSTGYADTNLIPSSILNDYNSHMSYYSRTNSLSDFWNDTGCQDDFPLGTPRQLYIKFAGTFVFSNQQNDGNRIFQVNANSLGFAMVSRTSQTNMKAYRNASIAGSNTTSATGARPGINPLLGGWLYRNSSGNLQRYYGDKQCAFSSIGDGLTDLESNLFYQIVEKYQYALGRNVNTNQSFYFNRNYSNETNAFIFNGAISDATQQSAINTLVNDLKAAGIWTKMKAVYPMVGGTATSHRFNLVNPLQYNLTFAGGWTHSSNGALPNGSTGYADTFFIPSVNGMSLNSAHIRYYSRTNTSALMVEMGIYDAETYSSTLLLLRNVNTASIRMNNLTLIDYSNTDSLGLHISNRTASNVITGWKNGIKKITSAVASTVLPANPIYIGAFRDGIGINYYSSKECAFSTIGDGLTDAEATTFYNAVQAFQTTLGRQV